MPLEPAYMKVSARAPRYLGRFRDGPGLLSVSHPIAVTECEDPVILSCVRPRPRPRRLPYPLRPFLCRARSSCGSKGILHGGLDPSRPRPAVTGDRPVGSYHPVSCLHLGWVSMWPSAHRLHSSAVVPPTSSAASSGHAPVIAFQCAWPARAYFCGSAASGIHPAVISRMAGPRLSHG